MNALRQSAWGARLRVFAATLTFADKLFLILLAVALVVEHFSPGGALATLVGISAFVIGVVVLIRVTLKLLRRMIWRLRNRLIVAYVLIAVVPLVLIVMLVGLGSWLLTGQIAAYLVTTELERRSHILLDPALGMVYSAQFRGERGRWMAPYFRDRFPGFEMVVRDGTSVWRYPENSTLDPPPRGWGDISGLLDKGGSFYLWAHAAKQGVDVSLLIPMGQDELSSLVPQLALIEVDSPRHRQTAKDRLPPAANSLDLAVLYAMPVQVAVWDSPNTTRRPKLLLQTRYSAVLQTLFSQNVEFAKGVSMAYVVAAVFLLIAAIFLIVEIFALAIGVRLTRTITYAVHNLYEGTQRVREADFSHRIEVCGNDQLAELSESFNRMTENLERLVVVAKEKERLQSELEIAREVQNQLYPKRMPSSRSLQLAASCQPARMVSGDYYDFLAVQNHKLALAIGDVAGKGISAALLMATVQASMRAQLRASREMAAAAAGAGSILDYPSTATLVSRLNQQLYAYTTPEKFATFCFGMYDETSGELAYTNAGHPPPILLRGSEVLRLEVTGTVVGAFPFSEYEESRIRLERGDLLVCFTDGVTEPENEYGEMFGEERLIEMLYRAADRDSAEIIASIVERVREWTGTPELQDDMTLLLARRI